MRDPHQGDKPDPDPHPDDQILIKQNQDPDPHQDKHQSTKTDADSHQSDANPQPCFAVYRLLKNMLNYYLGWIRICTKKAGPGSGSASSEKSDSEPDPHHIKFWNRIRIKKKNQDTDLHSDPHQNDKLDPHVH